MHYIFLFNKKIRFPVQLYIYNFILCFWGPPKAVYILWFPPPPIPVHHRVIIYLRDKGKKVVIHILASFKLHETLGGRIFVYSILCL